MSGRINLCTWWSGIGNLTKNLHFGNQELRNKVIPNHNEYKQKGYTGRDTDVIERGELLQ